MPFFHLSRGPAETAEPSLPSLSNARPMWQPKGDSDARGPMKPAVAQPDSIVFTTWMESELVMVKEKNSPSILHRISIESATSSSRDRILLTCEIFNYFAL
jgi:hypothetical protein